jgi:hypothetical protein
MSRLDSGPKVIEFDLALLADCDKRLESPTMEEFLRCEQGPFDHVVGDCGDCIASVKSAPYLLGGFP